MQTRVVLKVVQGVGNRDVFEVFGENNFQAKNQRFQDAPPKRLAEDKTVHPIVVQHVGTVLQNSAERTTQRIFLTDDNFFAGILQKTHQFVLKRIFGPCVGQDNNFGKEIRQNKNKLRTTAKF